jgi:3-oxoacyl-[acyl-carrier protein] reductase
MNIDLTHKRALVCGSTQGIGRAAAEALAALGAEVTLLARNETQLKAVRDSLPRPAGQAHAFLVGDFSEPEIVQDTVQKALESSGQPFHILLNNTGGPPGGPIREASLLEFHRAYDMHLACNHLLAQTVLPGMQEAGYGRIINVISTSVKIPIPGLGVSNTTRGAVASWAKTLAGEVAAHGITVNNLLPGMTATARLHSLIDKWADERGLSVEAMTEQLKGSIPAGRFADPKEVGEVIAFLASPAAAYVNGINLPVDGGRTGCL